MGLCRSPNLSRNSTAASPACAYLDLKRMSVPITCHSLLSIVLGLLLAGFPYFNTVLSLDKNNTELVKKDFFFLLLQIFSLISLSLVLAKGI